MKFAELICCPFCGNDTFYEKQKVKGYIYPNMRFDGDDDNVHNEDLYDSLDIFDGNGKAYCSYCNKYLGNRTLNSVSRKVEQTLAKAKGVDEQ